MNYNQIVEQHFFNPKNIGEITDGFSYIAKVQVGSDSMGEKIVLHLGSNSPDKVKAIRYKVVGSPYTIAAISLMSEIISTIPLKEAIQVNHQDLIQKLDIPITKQHCALLAIDAIHMGLHQLQQQIPEVYS